MNQWGVVVNQWGVDVELTNKQDVQRLGDGGDSNTIPKVLSDLIIHDVNILEKRVNLIQSGKTRGNTKDMKEYKSILPKQLDETQLSWSVGLLLSDATLQSSYSMKGQTFRLKIQQAYFNRSLLDATTEVLKPWVMGYTDIPSREMTELATILHEAFNPLAKLFQDPNVEIGPQNCVKKVIPSNIEDYLDPIAIGSWYCGDGGKRDYGEYQSGVVQFYSHGFSKSCNQRLADALKNRYGWNVRVVLDYTKDDGTEWYLLQVEKESFDNFIEEVKPFILPYFHKRLPVIKGVWGPKKKPWWWDRRQAKLFNLGLIDRI